MSSLNCSLLIHTFNKYEKYWPGLIDSYRKHWRENIPLYLGTDTENHTIKDLSPFKVLYSGDAEWSDRLINLLSQINTDYLIYAQEDHWLTAEPPKLDFLMQTMVKKDIWRLQISPIVHFYSLYGINKPFFFHERAKSKYLVAHNPSIWNKRFLLSCLEKGENPWQNEYRGTCRLWDRSAEIRGKIAIYPWNWYRHVVENGKFIG